VRLLIAALLLGGNFLLAQEPKPPVPPKVQEVTAAPKMVLNKEEEYHREALQAEWNLMMTQIQDTVKAHSEKLNVFIAETLKAHGNPKNVTFDPNTYSFVSDSKPKEEPKKADPVPPGVP
jgi:hypothetical protein